MLPNDINIFFGPGGGEGFYNGLMSNKFSYGISFFNLSNLYASLVYLVSNDK